MGTERPTTPDYPNGLKQLRLDAGLTQEQAAERFGMSKSGYVKVEGGERRLSADRIALARKIYTASLEEVLGLGDIQQRVVTARKTVQSVQAFRHLALSGTLSAGVFRDADVFNDQLDETVAAPPSNRFPWARQLAFRAEGDSMNEARPQPIYDGDYVVAIAYEDVQEAVELKTGFNVVVRQTRDGGQSYEWTVKELALFDDRTEFLPRSSNPRHKPIVVPRREDADDGRQVEIIGLLQYVFNNQEMEY